MTHTFGVTKAKYDASAGQTNPNINIVGSVDGQQYVFKTTWHQVQSAYSVGGTDAVQQVLAPLMLNSMVRYHRIPAEPQQEIPKFFGDVPAPEGPDATLGWVSVPEALCGSWTS